MRRQVSLFFLQEMDCRILKLVPIQQRRGGVSQLRQTLSTIGRGWYVGSPETAGGVLVGIGRRVIECDGA